MLKFVMFHLAVIICLSFQRVCVIFMLPPHIIIIWISIDDLPQWIITRLISVQTRADIICWLSEWFPFFLLEGPPKRTATETCFDYVNVIFLSE